MSKKKIIFLNHTRFLINPGILLDFATRDRHISGLEVNCSQVGILLYKCIVILIFCSLVIIFSYLSLRYLKSRLKPI